VDVMLDAARRRVFFPPFVSLLPGPGTDGCVLTTRENLAERELQSTPGCCVAGYDVHRIEPDIRRRVPAGEAPSSRHQQESGVYLVRTR